MTVEQLKELSVRLHDTEARWQCFPASGGSAELRKKAWQDLVAAMRDYYRALAEFGIWRGGQA